LALALAAPPKKKIMLTSESGDQESFAIFQSNREEHTWPKRIAFHMPRNVPGMNKLCAETKKGGSGGAANANPKGCMLGMLLDPQLMEPRIYCTC
jgi:hypothetical protein